MLDNNISNRIQVIIEIHENENRGFYLLIKKLFLLIMLLR